MKGHGANDGHRGREEGCEECDEEEGDSGHGALRVGN